MAPRSAWILGGATVVSLATATAAAALAARGNPLRLLSSHASYSLGNSVVDVAVYAWLHSIALLILLGAGLRDACHAKKVRVEADDEKVGRTTRRRTRFVESDSLERTKALRAPRRVCVCKG